MEMSQATYDRYQSALVDYEKVTEERQPGWEAYRDEAVKIRNFLSGAIVEKEVSKVLGKV